MSSENIEKSNGKKDKKPYLKLVIIVIIVIVIIAVAIILGGMLRNDEPDWTIVKAENGEIRINSSGVTDGEIHYYKTKNSKNGFFVFKNSDNEIKTRFSLCEPCEGKVFTLRENRKEIECNKCGTKWDTNNFKGISGSCQSDPPPPLEHYIDSGFIVIKESDL